ncbi:TetR/AcrR family transcriptional regulator [Sphingomonas azotifigens]|uniref:TetR/AcrR family transcriptional regulator n=1 Tax=Sphingomonas azotifigens TaxID=330920 RepID=UPI001FEA9260|nr:TetR/AcrR family transcriptional regulator [Sphingomonas azotifigens]
MAEATEAGGVPPRDKALLRREKIVSAARRLFIANGFHATGVAQIAKESGIAVGQIYRDFSSKEAIVAQIVRADCMDFLAPESLCAGIRSGDPEFVWRWLADFIRPEPDESDPLFAEIVAETARNERIAAIFQDTREEVRSTMLAALTALVPDEAFAVRRRALADVITAAALGLMHHRFISPAEDTDGAAALVLKMIRVEIGEMQAEAAAG